MQGIIKLGLLTSMLYLVFSCGDRRIEKLVNIPKEFQGEWVDDFAEFKLTINDNTIIRTDLTVDYDDSPLISDPLEIYYIKRADCEDCFEKGIELVFENERQWYFLEYYHPIKKSFDKLKVIDILVNPHTEEDTYFEPNIWKRIIN